MTKTEMNMHRINLGAVAAYLSGKQEEPDDAPCQHRMAVNRALKDLEKTNKELEKVRAYNEVLLAVAEEQRMIYGDQGRIIGELVRCKDCKHGQYEEWDNGEFVDKTVYCDEYGIQKPEWFCADGRRKDEDQG